MVAHVADPRVEPGRRVEHHPDEVGRELDMDLVEVEHVAQRLRPRGCDRLRLRRGGRFAPLVLPVDVEGRAAECERAAEERHEGEPRHHRKEQHQRRDGGERRWVLSELREDRRVGRARRSAAAIEVMTAGICVTSPSPTVRIA